MYGSYRTNIGKTVTPSGRSDYQRDLVNQNRNSALLPNFPDINGGKAMGNALKTVRTKSPVRRTSSSSNSVSRNSKLSDKFEYGGGSSVPRFAGKSHDSTSPTSTVNSGLKLRRNSSDSGYNSSGKVCETQIETRLSDGLQRVNLHNTSCGNNNYGQFSKNRSSTSNYDSSLLSPNKLERSKPSVSCGGKETIAGRSSRQTSLDLENTKPRSYVSDTSVLSKSVSKCPYIFQY